MQIERGRKWDGLCVALEKEFKVIDVNGNHILEKDELRRYLMGRLFQSRNNNVDQNSVAIMEEFIEQLFFDIDKNKDYTISLEELVDYYVNSLSNLHEDIQDLQERILDSNNRAE